jgi:hypothetical protein
VPAVYFVAPTEHNVRAIASDLKRALYDSFYLNMIYPLPRPLLEELAFSAVAGGAVQQVQKVCVVLFLKRASHFAVQIAADRPVFVLHFPGGGPVHAEPMLPEQPCLFLRYHFTH